MKAQNLRLAAITAAITISLTTFTPPAMAQSVCRAEDLQLVAPQNGSSVSGNALLAVNKRGAQVVLHAENLTPAVAYTVWFVYFDDASKCLVPNKCAPPDLTMPASAPEGVFGRMDSAVAGDDGELMFHGTMRDFRVSAGSAVHLALFAHGPENITDNQARARQLLTPETPGLGAPGLGLGTQKGFLVGAVMFDISACK